MTTATATPTTEVIDISLDALKAVFGVSGVVPLNVAVTGSTITIKRDGKELKQRADTVGGELLETGSYTAILSDDGIAFTKLETKPVRQSCTSMDRL